MKCREKHPIKCLPIDVSSSEINQITSPEINGITVYSSIYSVDRMINGLEGYIWEMAFQLSN